MSFWVNNSGHIITDASGHPIECDVCPCAKTPGVKCCVIGDTFPELYLWAYFEGTSTLAGVGLPGCLPNLCPAVPPINNGVYRSYGAFTGNTFSYGFGAYTLVGQCGCVNVRLVALCSPDIDGNLVYDFSIDMDFGDGSGYLGPQNLGGCSLSLPQCSYYAVGVAPGLASGDLLFDGFLLTTRDPATGILCPDGSIVQTSITFNITVNNAVGTPTLYSCSMIFAPMPHGGPPFCYEWRGYLADCSSGACTLAFLYFDSVNWNLYAQTNAGLPFGGDRHFMWSQAAFPTGGAFGDANFINGSTDWPACGAGSPTPTPMWSLTNP